MFSPAALNARLNLSIVGILLGTLFLSASLSPSLLPRPFAVQGLVSGISFAVGYGFGVTGLALWNFLQLPILQRHHARRLKIAAGVLCAVIAIYYLWQASHWQNAVRALMGMEEYAGLRPLAVGPIALLAFAILLTLARLFLHTFRFLSRRLENHLPPRITQVVGIAFSVWLFWATIDGVLVGFLMRTADQSFQQLDAVIEPDIPRPSRPAQTGSAESLMTWQLLGRQGRRFVSNSPDAEDLTRFFGRPLAAAVRVYVGLNSAQSPEQRARLALEELKRAGGFERSVLVLVTPTGTGWVDWASQGPLEYLLRGDVATVAVQYSYLNSPLALLTQGAYGVENARAVFLEIYGYWRTLPADSRPRLFLHGLSLGSLNSDLSFDLLDIIDDPFDGAFWVGPPFRHASWQRTTRDREPGTPAWLPRYRNGAVVRFMNQTNGLDDGYDTWNDFRIVFLQYASDPITFFDPRIAWREPDWMRTPRGPDVSPQLRWFPVVTMLQLAADMIVGAVPRGFGHEYAATDYIDAWLALAEPEGWTPAELDRLRQHFQ